MFYEPPPLALPPFQRDSKEKQFIYPPLWRCMYCGSKDQLSTEHIVPRGLGGNILFPRSTCEKCRKITHEFETVNMRKNFLYFRVHTGLHQHPKERPTHLPVRIRGSGTRLVLPSAHPNWLTLPLFMRPGILANLPLGMPFIIRGMHTTNPKNLTAVQTQYSEYFEVDYNFDVDAFAKLLAKIAHGLFCGTLHLKGKLSDEYFKPYLSDFIRGKNDNLGPYLIGQLQQYQIPDYDSDYYKYMLFTVRQQDKFLTIATIRLFSDWRGPDYTVVLGERLKMDES
jgi:HNH endonuclease